MKKHILKIAVAAVVLLASCATLMQTASLLTCNYNLAGVADPKLAGISLTSAKDVTNLDAISALKVTTALLSGSLPLSATVNLGVTNPNQTPAQLAGLDWQLFFEGVNMLEGSTTQAVNVAANGGKTTVPFTVQMDLAQLFKKDNKDQMLKFANGLLHLGEQNAQVSLKIRPSVSFGGQVFKSNYITVSKSL